MRTLLAAALLVMLASQSEAGFTVSASTTGNGTLEINGTAVANGATYDVFEGSGSLGDDMPLDIPGAVATVAAGTEFESYMFNLSKSPNNGTLNYELTLTFDQPILGIQFVNNTLADGYTLMNQAGSPFTPIVANGSINPDDSITISGNKITIAEGVLRGGFDPFRVLTAVPEMSTILSWSALAGVGCVLYRRRKQA
ncbi:hypothetical protein [Aeoliella mucimassa]|uniref:PEP-CTERM protein-sorting domain-containing protein n=1 Tax=Aeoliella mucimassa TaxID=2527972 RepID=A0A518AK69_9BACT|nr:hypothetical protein [Aeoliella mucimassa]QDU55074.1 hypothetical protein Pan181_12600 [Aeoliella mucimassa]